MELIDYAKMLNTYCQEKICSYKGELYSVRDNGAVYRHRPETRTKPRPLDNFWTFGHKNSSGYMMIGNHRVHTIIATAFISKPNSTNLVVDHIDTNRCNNRVENLRWLTRFENILNNPITRKKIEYLCGGDITKFLNNPACIQDLPGYNHNLSWMRTVTPEEANNAYKRITNWTLKPNRSIRETRNPIDDWIFSKPQISRQNSFLSKVTDISAKQTYTESLTQNAKQMWKTPTSFPLCPPYSEHNTLSSYMANMKIGAVIAHNEYSRHYIDEFQIYNDRLYIRSHSKEGTKPFALISIYYENGNYFHECDTFFEERGAKKSFSLKTGKEWNGPDGIDDYC